MSNQVRSGDFPQSPILMNEMMVPSTSQSPLADLARTTKDQASVIMSLTHLLEDKTLEVERLKSERANENDSEDMETHDFVSSIEVEEADNLALIAFVAEFERVLHPERPQYPSGSLSNLMKLYRQLPEWVRSQESPSSQSFQALKEQERALQAESYRSTGKYDQDLERIESPTGTSRKSEWLVADKSEPSAWQAPKWFRDEHGPTCQCSACVWNRPTLSGDYWNK